MELKDTVRDAVIDAIDAFWIRSMELKGSPTRPLRKLESSPTNPFNGIESQGLYAHVPKANSYESVQWNWKPVSASANAMDATDMGIRSMELKA